MKRNWRRYASVGLILSALGAVSTFFLALVKGVQMLGLFTPADPKVLNLALEISAGVIVLGLATYALMAPNKAREFFTGRQARYGSNALIMTLAFLGILAVANYLAFQHPQRWDLTEGKEHTLATETLQTLKSLPQKVQAVAYYSGRASSDQAHDLLEDFKTNSQGKFEYQFIDPDLNPLAAREAGVTGDAKIVLYLGTRKEIAAFASEQELTASLIRLISPQARAVYFLTGHGERDSEQAGDNSITRARQALESKNYTVNTLNLHAENQIPKEALAIIIAGPLKPVSAEEAALLKAYLAGGGALVIMQDPLPLTEFGDSPDPLGAALAEDWGITLNNDFVVDPSVNPVSNAVSYEYGVHPITEKMNQLVTIFPLARSLQISGQPENVNQTPLVSTIERAWGETDFDSLQEGKVSYDEGQDLPGPITLAIAAQDAAGKGRVVVFGNSTFASDQLFDSYGNGDLLINAIDWAAEQEELISLTPKEPIFRQLELLSQFQLLALLLGAVCLIPGLVIVGAITAWASRRSRG